MGIKEDYQQALSLAKKGKFEQARALLLEYDHPRTNALLKKLNDAIAVNPNRPDPQSRPVNPIVGILAALSVLSFATVVTVFLGTRLYDAYPSGFTNEWIIWLTLFVLWVSLLYLGHRLSRRLLQER